MDAATQAGDVHKAGPAPGANRTTATAPAYPTPSWRRSVAVAVAGCAGLAIVLTLAGLAITRELDDTIVGRWDLAAERWFVARQSDTVNAWSEAVSRLSATGTVAAVALLALLVCAARRWWREAAFLLTALAVNATATIVASHVVRRARPDGHLDAAIGTWSYPSGHVAAAIVLYGGLAVVVCVHARRPWIRDLSWAGVTAIVAVVAAARLSRGMHYPSDVAAGIAAGVVALLVAWRAIPLRADGASRTSSSTSA
jgi:undecaprenyl-diphosphatase